MSSSSDASLSVAPGSRKKIAVNTGGGDAPGLNAVIRAVVLSSLRRGWEAWGIRDGYEGLLTDGSEGLIPLDADAVRGITHLGGTILGTSNRGNPFQLESADGAGPKDRSGEVVRRFREHGFEALVAIGGDGSLSIARQLHERHGLPVVGVPKTIDNDLEATEYTFGFDTAVATATDAIGKLHSTAQSHRRVLVVEVMGRYAGWIALYSGLSGTADVVLLPEIPFRFESVFEKILRRERRGRRFSIVVVAEGATAEDGERVWQQQVQGQVRLGGIAERVANAIAEGTGKETRHLVLGHLQRGGEPTATDRLLSLRFGAAAIRAVERGEFGTMVALQAGGISSVSLERATQRVRTVPLDSDVLQTARDLGICLGD
ncbi:MAG: ATP-dependent 6-phosphofructokinase [Acidobacteriota bacterium]